MYLFHPSRGAMLAARAQHQIRHASSPMAVCSQEGSGREVLMGVGDGVASVIMLTSTKRPGPHADFYKEARPPC